MAAARLQLVYVCHCITESVLLLLHCRLGCHPNDSVKEKALIWLVPAIPKVLFWKTRGGSAQTGSNLQKIWHLNKSQKYCVIKQNQTFPHCTMYARGTRHMAYIRFPFSGDDLTGALHVLQLQFTTNNPCSNKIQNGGILLPAYPGCPGKWRLSECCCDRCRRIYQTLVEQ